jgi:hypothetical protein
VTDIYTQNCLEYFWTCDEVFRFWLTAVKPNWQAPRSKRSGRLVKKTKLAKLGVSTLSISLDTFAYTCQTFCKHLMMRI